ncbi:MAG: flagellar basal body-associated FliL family protein [Spirochaetaceae bacterium]|nr:flagellar basal body-associated FliL family protein [Spirochaetaceae bacterium]
MNYRQSGNPQRFLYLSRFLAGIVLVLVLCLAAGTLYALFFKRDAAGTGGLPAGAPLEGPPPENAAPDTASLTEVDGQEREWKEMFIGIDRIRAATAAPDSAAVILTITFPYHAGDKAFAEELSLRVPDFRAIALEYFSSFPKEELRQKNEQAIKTEMLRRFNAVLRLGRIETLYFSDYMIVD